MELTLERLDREPLHTGVERGADAQRRLRQQPVGEMRGQAGVELERAGGAERAGGQRRKTVAIGLARETAGASGDTLGRGLRVGEQGGEDQRVVAAQAGGRFAEQAERGGADPLSLTAKAREVEIGFEDLILAPRRLQRAAGAELTQLVAPCPGTGTGEIWFKIGGDLHRDGAGAPPGAAGEAVADRGTERQPVDAAMRGEAVILGGKDGVAHDRRDLRERGPRKAALREIHARGVDQGAVAVVEPRFRRRVGGADLGVGGQRGGRGVERGEGEEGNRDRQQRERVLPDPPFHACPANGAHRSTISTPALGSCARIAGEYIASTRLGGSE